ncbi:MAG: histidine phosphatase family protein [Acidaminobacteraceae bacterium]
MELLLIRHGEDSYKSSSCDNRPLSELAIKRAKALGKVLLSKGVDVMFTSPLVRALQTAEIISKETGIEYIVRNELVERKYDCVSNISGIEANRQVELETYDDMVLRATRLLVSIKSYEGKKVALISHSEILNVFINELLQVGLSTYPLFNLEPCGITKLSVSNFRANSVDYINNLKYLKYFGDRQGENTYNLNT